MSFVFAHGPPAAEASRGTEGKEATRLAASPCDLGLSPFQSSASQGTIIGVEKSNMFLYTFTVEQWRDLSGDSDTLLASGTLSVVGCTVSWQF